MFFGRFPPQRVVPYVPAFFGSEEKSEAKKSSTAVTNTKYFKTQLLIIS